MRIEIQRNLRIIQINPQKKTEIKWMDTTKKRSNANGCFQTRGCMSRHRKSQSHEMRFNSVKENNFAVKDVSSIRDGNWTTVCFVKWWNENKMEKYRLFHSKVFTVEWFVNKTNGRLHFLWEKNKDGNQTKSLSNLSQIFWLTTDSKCFGF